MTWILNVPEPRQSKQIKWQRRKIVQFNREIVNGNKASRPQAVVKLIG